MKKIGACFTCAILLVACGSTTPAADQVPSSAESSESVLLPEASGGTMGIPSMTGATDLTTQKTGTSSTVSDTIDQDEQIIREFYGYIGEHAFSQAYELYGVKKMSLQAFEKMYKDVESIDVVDLKKGEDGSYALIVNLEESGSVVSTFNVVMVVKNGKIETKSSKLRRSSSSSVSSSK
jgi:hypothetical protein